MAGGSSNTEYVNLRGAARFLPNKQVTVDFSVNYSDELLGISEEVGTGVS